MSDKTIIQQLSELLTEGHAHVTFENSVADIPFEKVSIRPEKLPYNIWQLVEHIRITQADILDFSRNPDYAPIRWPDDYWPREVTPKDGKEWEDCLHQIRQDRDAFIQLISTPGTDLFSPFPHGDGQNLFREALLIADHTSYHTGQILLIRRFLDEWS